MLCSYLKRSNCEKQCFSELERVLTNKKFCNKQKRAFSVAEAMRFCLLVLH